MKKLKRTQIILMTLFIALIVLALALVVVYETNILEPGTRATHKQSEFMLMTTMELLTLAGAFLGLRLFKFKVVHKDLLSNRADALLPLGIIRICLIEVPMVANTLFYYMFMNTTFGYLAIILLLCLPFVFPSLERCQSDIE
jgi:hypothetical protein